MVAISSDRLIVGLSRACWLLAALVFLVFFVSVLHRYSIPGRFVYALAAAAMAFGLGRMVVWVVRGFLP